VSTLEVRALSCSRGLVALFRDVSLRVAPGEWVSVRGPNGCGKTTLLRCIAGLTQPDSGDVLWDGLPTRRHPARFHQELCYSGHLAGIKDDLTAEENLAGLLALRAISPARGEMRAALAAAGLDQRRQLPARRLSAGQRRRIGLARLALDGARLWALDEPLTALDDDGRMLFEGLLAGHLRRGGAALIATHHDLAPAPAHELRMGA
jgi:heme exporter protein A